MVSKRSVASHGTPNAGHSTPPQPSGIAGRVQTRHSARLAAEREELLQRTGTRKSARIAALAVPPNLLDRDLPSTSSDSRASTDSSTAQAPKTPRKPREQVYKPFRDARIGWITPPKRLVCKDSRPGMDDVAAVAPMRDVCPLTGRCRADKTNECAHLADAATPSAEVTRIERFVGVAPRRLCLHTRLNLFVLSKEIHSAMDGGLLITIPLLADLQKLYDALNEKVVHGWDKDEAPKKNAAGYIHHEDVFPFILEGRDYRAVPLLNWGRCPIPFVKRLANGRDKYGSYGRPFTTKTGKPVIPLMKSQCGPHFAVYKAYKTLTREDVGEDKAPAYVEEEVGLIMEIGRITVGEVPPEVA
ncbi:hypothetical protein EV121DRAFT_215188 [Schizophyllum commune]